MRILLLVAVLSSCFSLFAQPAYKNLVPLLERASNYKKDLALSAQVADDFNKKVTQVVTAFAASKTNEEQTLLAFKDALIPLLADLYNQTTFQADLIGFAKENNIDVSKLEGISKAICCWCSLQVFQVLKQKAQETLKAIIIQVAQQQKQSVAELTFKTEFLNLYLIKQFFVLQKASVDNSKKLLQKIA